MSAGHYCFIEECCRQTISQSAEQGKEMVTMRRRIAVTLGLVACAMFIGANAADAILITFTENSWTYDAPPPNTQNTSLTSDEFVAQGILIQDVYQYADDRDVWNTLDPVGLAPSTTDTPGVIAFVVPTNAVTVEWWFQSFDERTIHVEAYNSSGDLLDEFEYGGEGPINGTDTLTGFEIAEIRFFDHTVGAFPGISSIDFEPVPEPATILMLGCLGAGLAGATKLRRKKK